MGQKKKFNLEKITKHISLWEGTKKRSNFCATTINNEINEGRSGEKKRISLFPLPPQHDIVDPKAEAIVSSLRLRIEGERKKRGIDDTVAISLKISPSDFVESGSEVRSLSLSLIHLMFSLMFSHLLLLYCYHLYASLSW